MLGQDVLLAKIGQRSSRWRGWPTMPLRAPPATCPSTRTNCRCWEPSRWRRCEMGHAQQLVRFPLEPPGSTGGRDLPVGGAAEPGAALDQAGGIGRHPAGDAPGHRPGRGLDRFLSLLGREWGRRLWRTQGPPPPPCCGLAEAASPCGHERHPFGLRPARLGGGDGGPLKLKVIFPRLRESPPGCPDPGQGGGHPALPRYRWSTSSGRQRRVAAPISRGMGA